MSWKGSKSSGRNFFLRPNLNTPCMACFTLLMVVHASFFSW